MNIYPAIDIKSGKCVRLYQGKYDQITTYENNPVVMAKSFAAQGASFLHVVDLDGAKTGISANLDIIFKIVASTQLNIQIGGGIRTEQQIINAFNAGIDRVILGSTAITQPKLVKDWIQKFGPDRIVLALDVGLDTLNIPKLVLHGWQVASEITLWQLLDEYQNSLLQNVLCTDISRDGTMQGPNITLYEECVRRYPQFQFQASGGVSTLNDLKQLSKTFVSSVIIGKALYENNFSLKNAFTEVVRC